MGPDAAGADWEPLVVLERVVGGGDLLLSFVPGDFAAEEELAVFYYEAAGHAVPLGRGRGRRGRREGGEEEDGWREENGGRLEAG